MPDAPTLFFDVGGVLLTNGWDTGARSAAETFGLDHPEFQTRHEMLKTAFETGRLTSTAIFARPSFIASTRSPRTNSRRSCTRNRRRWATRSNGSAAPGTQEACRLFTLNNESKELHENRVRTFGLDTIFQGFLTSCYLGQAKPDEGIYITALGIACCERDQAVFIDDRLLNVEPAHALGLNAVHYQNLDQLRTGVAGVRRDGLKPRPAKDQSGRIEPRKTRKPETREASEASRSGSIGVLILECLFSFVFSFFFIILWFWCVSRSNSAQARLSGGRTRIMNACLFVVMLFLAPPTVSQNLGLRRRPSRQIARLLRDRRGLEGRRPSRGRPRRRENGNESDKTFNVASLKEFKPATSICRWPAFRGGRR